MRQKIGVALLVLATGFLGFVMGDRYSARNPGPTSYEATRYSLHVRAVDTDSGEPLPFSFIWPKDEVSPFGKGSGPAIMEVREDGSKSLDVVGLHWPDGMNVQIQANGYQDAVIRVVGNRGGLTHRRPGGFQEVKMQKVLEPATR